MGKNSLEQKRTFPHSRWAVQQMKLLLELSWTDALWNLCSQWNNAAIYWTCSYPEIVRTLINKRSSVCKSTNRNTWLTLCYVHLLGIPSAWNSYLCVQVPYLFQKDLKEWVQRTDMSTCGRRRSMQKAQESFWRPEPWSPFYNELTMGALRGRKKRNEHSPCAFVCLMPW